MIFMKKAIINRQGFLIRAAVIFWLTVVYVNYYIYFYRGLSEYFKYIFDRFPKLLDVFSKIF